MKNDSPNIVRKIKNRSFLAFVAALKDAWQKNEVLISPPSHTLSGFVVRYGIAVATVVAALWLRLAVTSWVGPGLPTYLTFYPAIMVVALLAGFGPGLTATALSGLVVAYWVVPPIGRLSIESPVERVGMVIFTCMGLFMSVFAELYRRNRKKAAAYDREAFFRENQARLAAFAEASFEGIIESEAGRIADCNEQFARLLGYSVVELKGIGIADLVPPEERDRVMANISPNRDSNIEHTMLCKDGKRIIVETHGRPLYPGSAQRHTAVRDITERKRAEEELRRSEHRFRTMADAIPQLAWTARADGWISWYNRRWYEYTGTTPEQMEGWGWQHVHDPQTLPKVLERWKSSLETGEPFDMVFPLRGADGIFRPFLTRIEPLKDDRGRVVQWFGTGTDISEQRREKEELTVAKLSAEQAKATAETANLAKDNFLAVLSHELRTPLTPIVMGVSMLQDRPNLDSQTRETLEMVRQNIEMEARLIDDLLDVTRIAHGKIELNRNPVELSVVIRRAVEVCKPDIEARDLHFGVDMGSAAPYWVDADVPRLQQVFWNLLKNAVKFTPHSGCVGIRCRRNEGHVVVEVNDSGIGIEHEALSRIFNAFEQSGPSVPHQFGGLGLGLAISKALVEMHGGEIEARSEGRNKGATFCIRLPLAAPAGQSQVPTAAAPAIQPMRPLNILLVEDHGVTARMIRMVLVEKGHTVETAGDVSTALKLADQHTFDLLLSDLGLPDGTGHDLLRELRSRGHNFAAIALSGYGQEEDIRRSYRTGFAAHLIKPASREAVFAAVAAAATGNEKPDF